jgi:UDP-N-acetylmuramate dehydrogenase
MLEKAVSLRSMNTFGLEAKAALYFRIHRKEELSSLWKTNLLQLASPLVLGGGSNIVFKNDYHGLVLHNCLPGREVVSEDPQSVRVRFGAGEFWHDCVMFAVSHGWGGVENLSLIPGTIGAAPIQNIGAYGTELKDVFDSLEAFDLESGEVRIFDKDACAFGYRDSYFKREGKGRYCILSVVLKLSKQPVLNISYGDIQATLSEMGIKHPGVKDVSAAVIQIRQSKLPDPKKLGNCGSFFKNPMIPRAQYEALKASYPDLKSFPAEGDRVKIPAAWLIEQDGWKGKRIGNTGSHARQALVLVNYGGASGEEVANLADRIAGSVMMRFGVTLEREVNILG